MVKKPSLQHRVKLRKYMTSQTLENLVSLKRGEITRLLQTNNVAR